MRRHVALVTTPRLTIRPLHHSDARTLAHEADDPRIAVNLRDGFPTPYGTRDARRYISLVTSGAEHPLFGLAITRGDEVIGCIGLTPGRDVYRRSGEVGYWIGVRHWGQGFATEALMAFTRYIFESTDLVRLHGDVFSGNPGSCRVLEKCGYRRESVQRCAVYKDGVLRDLAVYVRLRDDVDVPRSDVS